jgi:hypothetical protein
MREEDGDVAQRAGFFGHAQLIRKTRIEFEK